MKKIKSLISFKELDKHIPLAYIVIMKPLELVKWRKKNDYSQIKLGKALGVSTITVYRWEKAMRQVPPFLHLALECLETKGGQSKAKGKTKKTKKERR